MSESKTISITQFLEPSLKEHCTLDCNSCVTFPAPFRRIGESSYCRFAKRTLEVGSRMSFAADRMLRLVFITSGAVRIEHDKTERSVVAGQSVCLARGEHFEFTAQESTEIIILSLIHRIEFCEQDIFTREMPYDSIPQNDSAAVLKTHPSITYLLSGLFGVPEIENCARFHSMKVAELFMFIKVLYTPAEHAYFFQSIIQPQDNFRVFVCNNYDKAQGVAELAALAGMSLSVFKRRFAEHFNDSVYHWMMRQKALKVFGDIRAGEDSTKALMSKYGFRHYTQFSRFCKTYLQSTPAQLISSIKEG